jgi:uncharacterized protein DUF1573
MKKIILGIGLFFFIVSVISVICRRNKKVILPEDGQLTSAYFSKKITDVGDQKLHSVVEAMFTIYNTGKNDLYIKDVRPDCHCTVANYIKEPIHPKDSSEIILKYNSSLPGVFQSSAIVTTNSLQSPTILIFRGNIGN